MVPSHARCHLRYTPSILCHFILLYKICQEIFSIFLENLFFIQNSHHHQKKLLFLVEEFLRIWYTTFVKERKLTKSFKFFNVLQVIFFGFLALASLLATVAFAVAFFNITALDSIVTAIINYLPVILAYSFNLIGVILDLFGVTLSGDISMYIIVALCALFFIWTLSMFIRLMRPKNHYQKGHVFSNIINFIIAAIMGYTGYTLASPMLQNPSYSNILNFAICALFVVVAIVYLILSIKGKHASANPTNHVNVGGFVPPARPVQAPPPPPLQQFKLDQEHDEPAQNFQDEQAQQPIRRPPPPPPPRE